MPAAVPYLLAYGPSLDEIKRFAVNVYEFAREEPMAASYWALVWTGGFVVTFLLVRMFFTRWGDRDITKKTLGVSLLVHLLLGMVSNRVVFGPGFSPDADSGGALTIRNVAVEGADSGDVAGGSDQGSVGASNLPGRSPAWEQAPKLTAQSIERQQAPEAGDASAAMLPEKQVEGPQPLALPAPDVAERTKGDVTPEPQRNDSKLAGPTEIGQPTIDEETAEARPEADARAGSAARTSSTGTTDEPSANDAAPPRTRSDKTTASVQIDPGTPTVAATVPQAADPRVPGARRSNSAESPRMNSGSPKAIASDEGAAEAPVADGSGAAGGQKFSRTNRTQRGSSAPGAFEQPGSGTSGTPGSTGLPDRGLPNRGQGSGSPGTGIAGAPLESRTGGGSAIAGMSPARIRTDSDGAIDKNAGKVPATYRMRTSPQRQNYAGKMGANADSERAVELSLKWLAAHQNPNGYWEPVESTLGQEPEQIKWDSAEARAERERSGFNSEAGLTALAVLAFLGKGYTHEDNVYAENVDLALRWLVAQQDAQGFLGGRANKYARMYCHGMATIALGEAYGMTKDRTLREPLVRAVQYIINAQYPDGSWRYTDWRRLPSNGRQADMSMFGWQVMALKSAKTAGLDVPEEAFQNAVRYLVAVGDNLKSRGLSSSGGLASYRLGEQPKPSMTAEALFCKQLLGIRPTNLASIEAVEYLQRNVPVRSKQDLYYWYYGTLAMFHHGGNAWQRWNEPLRDNLVADQRDDGDFAGSWNPRSPWGDYGGRVFSTAISTLCLEVYYRYQRDENDKIRQSSAK